MGMKQTRGKQSIEFKNDVYILDSASIVGKKEGEGPYGEEFDMVCEDDRFGCETWEESESSMLKESAILAMGKAGVKAEDVNFVFSGDLLGQSIATSFGMSDLPIPLFGLFGACSTSGEALCLSSMAISGGYAKTVLAVTSSHFATAEKQFRFPLGYANQKPLSSTWTVTGSGAFIVSEKPGLAKITGITIGKIVDFGVKDSSNMGAAMAPAAADTIMNHLNDFERTVEDYDKIITGDLGKIGTTALTDMLGEEGIHLGERHMDCGLSMFDIEAQKVNSGGSGCGCAASILSAVILKKIQKKEWKRVLFLPTGALMSQMSYNEGETIPAISHGVVIEAV